MAGSKTKICHTYSQKNDIIKKIVTVQFIGLIYHRRENYMSRTNTRKRVDKKIFKHTAATTKKVNVAPKVLRGGIRL